MQSSKMKTLQVPSNQNQVKDQPVLIVKDLDISYYVSNLRIQAIRKVSFEINPGQAYALVGESGSGKSTVALAIMNYLESNGKIERGEISFRGDNLVGLTRKKLWKYRGLKMALVPQEPQTSLNPSHRVGEQIAEILQIHLQMTKLEARERAIEMLYQVNMPDPEIIVRKYPHEISGGQQQRILIAMAFCTRPDLLIMDEPTTSLDVTTEVRILDIIEEMKIKYNTAILYITHNLGVVKRLCNHVAILYAGEIVEEGNISSVFNKPYHPYTRGLINCIPKIVTGVVQEKLEAIEGFLPDLSTLKSSCIFSPRCSYRKKRCLTEKPALINIETDHLSKCFFYKDIKNSNRVDSGNKKNIETHTPNDSKEMLLKVNFLKKFYKTKNGELRAVDGVDLECKKGEILGVVGESGCGKTTLARCIVGLLNITKGEISLDDKNIAMISQKRNRQIRQKIQMVFQNPDASLNPQKTIEQILSRPLALYKICHRKERRGRIIDLLEMVKLNEKYLSRYPHELSGGEKQRVGIARAFAADPALVICDEPISSLDVSVQAGIINLLIDLQKTHNISYIFIGHDLNVIRHISNRIIVMYMGKVCEVGTPNDLFNPPYHPYTEALLSAVPIIQDNVKQRKICLEGPVPSPVDPLYGCAFHTRCPRKIEDICIHKPPPEVQISPTHILNCHIPIKQLMEIPNVFEYEQSDQKITFA